MQFISVLVSEDVHVIHLHPNVPDGPEELGHGRDVVVPLPVRVDDVVPVGSPPGLASVHQGAHRGLGVGRDHQGVGAAHGAVEVVGEVDDVVVGGEHTCINIL